MYKSKLLQSFLLLTCLLFTCVVSRAQIENSEESTQNIQNQNISSTLDYAQLRAIMGTEVKVLELEDSSGNFGTYPLEGPYNLNFLGVTPNRILGSDTDGDGTIYGLVSELNQLVTVNKFTGMSTVIGSLNGLSTNHLPTGLAWDPTSNTMYALSVAAGVSHFYSIDLTTGTMTFIGNVGISNGIWIVIDNDGVCYMASIGTDTLYTIDKNTGVASEVGPLGVNLNNSQEADVDVATNTIYMAAAISGSSNNNAVYIVDKNTGATSFVGSLGESIVTIFAIDSPITNGICSEATEIQTGITPTSGIDNAENGASNICLSGATNSIWYSYTAFSTGMLTITSDLPSNGAIDTRVSVYNDNCNALTCIASDDNSGANNRATVSLPVTSGTTYFIEWDDANDNTAFDFELSLDIPCPDPENFNLTDVTFESADFSWDNIPEATDGYILQVFTQGSDPQVDAPVYEETIPASTTIATATGLEGSTSYDAYLNADCAANGTSNAIALSFQTNIAPPLCGEAFYDTGGPDAPYQNEEDYTLLIENTDPNAIISVVFTLVDIEADFDFLRIYDGDDTSATELTGVDGVLSPNIFSSTIPGGNIFVTFSTDEFTTRQGWTAFVLCEETTSCGEITNFEATSRSQESADFNWEINGGAAASFNLEVFLPEENPSTETPVFSGTTQGNTPEMTATGLSPNTEYTAYVRANCDGGGNSITQIINFITFPSTPMCSEMFFDTGGVTEPYGNNEDYFLLIENTGDEPLEIEFTEVSIETGFDFLRIYDGDDDTAPELTDANGVQAPGVFSSSTATGNLYITFSSDDLLGLAGWEATVNCNTLSTLDVILENISTYPNPMVDKLNLENLPANTVTSFKMYTLSGQKVIESSTTETTHTLNLNGLSPGVYFLKISTLNGISMRKFIKE